MDLRGAAIGSLLVVAASACGRPAAPSRDGERGPAPTGGGSAGVILAPGALETTSPVEALVKSAELAPYWHAERPGRVPVVLVGAPDSKDRPAFTMFGAPVRWIERGTAAAGSAVVELGFTLTDGVLTLRAAYPIEGVQVEGTYFPDGAGWRRQGPIRVVER